MSGIEKQYETVDMWLRKACGSEVTEKIYLSKFKAFLEYYGIKPEKLIAQWKCSTGFYYLLFSFLHFIVEVFKQFPI